VKPVFTGQYVTGILVKEYRKGKLINVNRRDFQFNVLNCVFNVVSAFSKDIHLCSDTVNFINQSMGADSFYWDFGDSLSSEDTSTAFQPSYIYPGSGKYSIRLLAAKGNCMDSVKISLTIDKDIGSFAGEDRAICIGDTVILGSENSGFFQYLWSPSDFLSDTIASQPVAKTPVSIRYVVTRKSEVCTNSDTIDLLVRNPIAAFTAHTQNLCKDFLLKIDSPDFSPAISWLLNGRPVSGDALNEMRFAYGQAILLKMILRDSSCYDTAFQIISPFHKEGPTDIPNVFTPGDDGLNDCYVPGVELSADCSRLIIYNRWGELLFDSNRDGSCWNGYYRQRLLSAGVYFYILQHTGKDYHGTITLIH
jgi:gliding motility-associated-like protein